MSEINSPGIPPIDPFTQNHVPTIDANGDLQDIVNAFLQDDGVTVAFSTDSNRALQLTGDQEATLESVFQNVGLIADTNSKEIYFKIGPQVKGRFIGTLLSLVTNILISRTSPEFKMTDNNSTRLTRMDTNSHAALYNETNVLATDPLVESVLVAGGGGGACGGGGAGGVLQNPPEIVSVGTYPIVIGNGGAGATMNNPCPNGTNGQDTTFNSHTAIGGGGGAGANNGNGSNGGSGGGGGSSAPGSSSGGTGTAGQGHNGGNYHAAAPEYTSGGGGGAGAAGQNAPSDTQNGNGGNGVASPVPGDTDVFGGGGGGNDYFGSGGTGTPGNGGTGGGGNAGDNGSNGTDGLGGGGGGAASSFTGNTGGTGGKGRCKIWYLTGSLTATGGTITTYGAYTIHDFTSSGNFVVTSVGASTVQEGAVVESIDSDVGGEKGIQSFSNDDGRSVIKGRAVINGFRNLPIADVSAGGDIGTAANTVDMYNSFDVDQTTAAQTLTLPTPTTSTDIKVVYVSNIGSTSFTMLGVSLAAGASLIAKWTSAGAWSLCGHG